MDFSVLHTPAYTGITTAVLVVLQIALMVRVIMQRGKDEVDIGDGGKKDMLQAMRVHGNLVENAPAFLVTLALLELMTGSTVWVLSLGAVFVLARILHAIGLSVTTGVHPGRLIGTLGTMLSMLVAALYLAYVAVGAL